METKTVFVEPWLDEHFILSDAQKAFLRAIAHIRKERPVNVGVRGPTGTGKTYLAEWFAAMTKSPLFVLDMATVREPKDVFGFKTLDVVDGHQVIRWQRAGFVEALTTPNAVIVLDEANRVHASVANGLFPLLDYRRRVYLDDLGETIKVAEGVTFFLTANIGAQYTGTWRWDAALENRIDFQIEVGYLSIDDEVRVLTNKVDGLDERVARRCAEVASVIRQKALDENEPMEASISTRQLLRVGELIQTGLSPVDAFQFGVVATFSTDGGTESDRANLLSIIQGKLAEV